MKSHIARCAALIVIAVALLGADPSPAPVASSDAQNPPPVATAPPGVNPDYMQFIGSWSCTKPSGGANWTATLDVRPVSHGEIEFLERFTGNQSTASINGGRVDHFYLSEDTKSGEWSQRDPLQPWLRTGMMKNGTIIFADPKPNPGRYGINISPDGQVLTMLPWDADAAQQRLTYEDLIIKCTRTAS